MPTPDVEFIGNMDTLNPVGTDPRTISDNTHRNIAESVRQTLPFLTGEVTATHLDMNLLSGIQAAGNKLMQGQGGVTTIVFYNPTVPVGWSVVVPDANLRAIIIGPDAAGGVIGGSQDPTSFSASVTTTVTVASSGNTNGTILTVNEIPGHEHFTHNTDADGCATPSLSPSNYAVSENSASANRAFVMCGTATVATVGRSSETGGNGAHNHGVTDLPGSGTGTGSTANITPRYAQCVLGRLDA